MASVSFPRRAACVGRFFPLLALAFLGLLSLPATAGAQGNATQQTNNDIVRASSQSAASLVGGRIEFVNAPTSPPPAGGGQTPDSGIPVPGKDRASLPSPVGSVPGLAGQTMLALSALGAQTGLSAGDAATRNRCGVWGMTAVNWLGSDKGGASFDGNLVTAMAGFDYRIIDPLVAGVSVGYQGLGLDTHYNAGWLKSSGYTVMPYASYALTPNLVADASFGLTFNNYNSSRIDTGQNQEVTGHYNALRALGAANLTYSYLVGNWTLSAKAGTILANEHQYSYVETNSTRHAASDTFLGELIVGAKAGYRYKMFVPQIGVSYLYDYALTDGGPRDEVQGLVGLGLQATERLLFNVECNNSFFREHTRNTSLIGSLRFEF